MLIAFKLFYRGLFKAMLNSISIAVGVTAVLIINALSNYGIDSANNMLNRMGFNGYIITADFVLNDSVIRIQNCHSVKKVSPINRSNGEFQNNTLPIVGGNTAIKDIYSVDIIRGGFFSKNDVDCIKPVCVISSALANDIFGTDKCIGQEIIFTVESIAQGFTIVGVYKSDSIINSTIGQKEPVYVPHTIIESINTSNTKGIVLLTNSQNNSTQVIRKQLDNILGDGFYSIENIAEEREKINTLMSLIKNVLEIIVGVSLVVSIIGLMVIMIINIRSRAGEIGLKKALGASNKAIVYETVIDAVMTASVGIFQGAVIYTILMLLLFINGISLYTDVSIYITVSFSVIISAVLIGLIPAYIAARIDPAKALNTD